MSNSTEKVTIEHQHHSTVDSQHIVACTIIQRHRDKRQRFDSADYEMAQRASGTCDGCGKCADLEHEPEPGSTSKRDQLRCLRLQRFDSADWALQTQRSEQSPQTDSSSSSSTNVALMLMDRHALKTCAYVGPQPVKNEQLDTEK